MVAWLGGKHAKESESCCNVFQHMEIGFHSSAEPFWLQGNIKTITCRSHELMINFPSPEELPPSPQQGLSAGTAVLALLHNPCSTVPALTAPCSSFSWHRTKRGAGPGCHQERNLLPSWL